MIKYHDRFRSIQTSLPRNPSEASPERMDSVYRKAEVHPFPTVVQKLGGQLNLSSLNGKIHHVDRHFPCGSYSSGIHKYRATKDFNCAPSIVVQAPSEKEDASFLELLHPRQGLLEAVGHTAAAPLERVKLLIQNQNAMIKSGRLSEPYKGIVDCCRRTVKGEGAIKMFRGNLANVLNCFPDQVIKYTSYDYLRRHINLEKCKDSYWKCFAVDVAAYSAFLPAMLPFYPLLFIRTRLATDISLGGERQFNGMVNLCKKTIKSDGISGLYRGFNIFCVGNILQNIIYVGTKTLIKPTIYEFYPPSPESSLGEVLVKAASGFTAYTLCYPFETVCMRMMMTSGEPVKYMNSLDAFNQIIKNEGAMSLLKGMGSNMLVFPVSVVAVFSFLLLENKFSRDEYTWIVKFKS